MSDFEVCPVGTLQRLAAAEVERDALRAENADNESAIVVWRGRTQRVEAERDAVLIALEKIAGFTLSQFMGPHDMALECVTVARAAIDAAKGGGNV